MDYETAVDLLQAPETWCQGATFLAQSGERRALVPLLRAYEKGYEGARGCLLDALEALEPLAGAHELFSSSSQDEQRMAVHLMELFPDESHLPRLEQAVTSDYSPLRLQAARTLVTQKQTPAWERLMIRLLDAPDDRLRQWIIEGLGYCRRDSARQALRTHLQTESNPKLKTKIEKALG
jgi:hypothetical protein